MVHIEYEGDRLKLSHRMTGISSFGVAIYFLIAFSCLVVPPLSAIGTTLSPKTIVIACQRSSGQCKGSGRWAWTSEFTFPLSRLNDFFVDRSGDGLNLGVRTPRGNPDSWSGPVSSQADKEKLEASVQRLRDFPSGTDPAITAEIPNGHRFMFAMLFVFAVGLLMLRFVRLFIWRLTITGTKHDLTVITHRILWIRRKTQVTQVSAILSRVKRSGNRYVPGFMFLALHTEKGELPIIFEIYSRKGNLQQDQVATALGHFLGVPVARTEK